MIDLHIHTLYSDGTDSVTQILKKAQKANLEIISITDHNTCKAYEELDKTNISNYFNGKIITGCEFTTSFNNNIIEIIGYGFNYKVINEFLTNYYNESYWKKRNIILGNKLVDIIIKKGFKINLNRCVVNEEDYDYYSISKIFEEVIRNSDNIKYMDEDIFSSFAIFIRKGLYNQNSSYYLEYSRFFPKLEEVINLIHINDGKSFLAHPYEYGFNDTNKFLNNIYNKYNIDGIECFYTTFNKRETDHLIDFANKNYLLICGGTDYHGTNKQNHELAIGNGNLNIKKGIIDNWNINFYKK